MRVNVLCHTLRTEEPGNVFLKVLFQAFAWNQAAWSMKWILCIKWPRRRSYEIAEGRPKSFSTHLRQLGGNKQPVGNITLRERLHWDETKYTRIHRQLVTQRKVIPGKGKGESVMLPRSEKKGLAIFIAYSHADEDFKNDLVKHLDPLRRLGLIDVWHDRKIKPGDVWDSSISSN
jgi:hypothetical protein